MQDYAIEHILARYPAREESLIEIMQHVQTE